MSALLQLLAIVVNLYMMILIARIIIEMIRSFSRNFRAPSWFIVIAEACFVVTDPPVKALRRLIPPLQLGGVALDVSVLVLFFALSFLRVMLMYAGGAVG